MNQETYERIVREVTRGGDSEVSSMRDEVRVLHRTLDALNSQVDSLEQLLAHENEMNRLEREHRAFMRTSLSEMLDRMNGLKTEERIAELLAEKQARDEKKQL